MRTFLVAACALGLSWGLCVGANAQAVESIPEPARAAGLANPAGVENRYVAMRNVPPAIMAYWLDPRGQPEPLQYTFARGNASALAGDIEKQMRDSLPRPRLAPGAVLVKAVDKQNALMLRGEPEALDQWEREIGALDKPLRQVEVHSQIMRLTPEALRHLGLSWDKVAGSGQAHLLGEDAEEKWRSLVKAKQAVVMSGPRITAISGLAASLHSATQTPARLVPRKGLGKDATALAPSGPVEVQWRIGLAAHAVLLDDGSTDLTVAAGTSWWIEGADGPVPLRRAPQVSFRALPERWYLFAAASDPVAPGTTVEPGALDKEGRAPVVMVRAWPVRRFGDDAAR